MQNQQIPNGWHKPKQERKSDALDHELFAIGKVHKDAMDAQVGLPPYIFRLIRDEFYAAQTINRALLPEERAIAIRLLKDRQKDESTLDILKCVFALRKARQ
jgi:hypothetical protein